MYLNFMELIRDIKINIAPKVLAFESIANSIKKTFDDFSNMFLNVKKADTLNNTVQKYQTIGVDTRNGSNTIYIDIEDARETDFVYIADIGGKASINNITVKVNNNQKMLYDEFIIDVDNAIVQFKYLNSLWTPLI